MEEWSEQARQTYGNDSDSESSKHFLVQGMSTVHGSQWFQNQDALLDPLKRTNTQGGGKGHSIGYYQNTNKGLQNNGKLIKYNW